MTEICRNCGDSVAWGSGKFVNRIPDCNDVETRKENGDQFPEGEYLCSECEEKFAEGEIRCDKCGSFADEHGLIVCQLLGCSS